jgi:hypothetical protein
VRHIIFARRVSGTGLAKATTRLGGLNDNFSLAIRRSSKFTARNFMFVPIETPSIGGAFRGLIILSGVAIIDFGGIGSGDWRRDQVILDLNVDLGQAIHLAPYTPPPLRQFVGFSIAQSVPFATVNARLARLLPQHAVHPNDGTAVDAFFSSPGGAMILIDVAVRNVDSVIHRLGYHLSLYGTLVARGVVGGDVEGSTSTAGAPAG